MDEPKPGNWTLATVPKAVGITITPEILIAVENGVVSLRFGDDVFDTDSKGARALGKLLLEIADSIDNPS